MSSLNDSNTTDTYDNTLCGIMGGTDNTRIGNLSDRLLVDSAITSGSVSIGGLNIDAFGRLRTCEPHTIFEYTFPFDERPQIFTSKLTSGGTLTYDSNKKAAVLNCTTTTNSECIYQTRRYIKYNPGKSSLIFLTGNLKSKVANVIKRYGQFDDNNGFFFELNGTTANVVIRSKVSGSVVDNAISQSSWNTDKMDGTGTSGITIDFSKELIFFINYQWLGAGSVQFGFVVNRIIYVCHQFNHSNLIDTLYSQTATLPIRASVKNTASTSATVEMTCGAVISEGGVHTFGRSYTASNGTTSRSFSGAGSRIPVLSLRKQTAYLGTEVVLYDVGFFFNSADDFFIEIVKNPTTLTGASWANVPGIMQKDVSATAISGGDIFFSSYGRGSASASGSSVSFATALKDTTNLAIDTLLDGTSEILSIVLTNITSSASAFTYANYKELL